MTQSLGMRATSFGASATLLGLAVFAAFSITISFQPQTGEQLFPLTTVLLAPDDPPPIVRRETPPPPVQEDTVIADIDPLPTTVLTDVAPQETILPVASGPPVITNPRWLRQPRDLGVYYPSRALARDITGTVMLNCVVEVSGALNCVVESETPANWGFGQAALRISRDYRMVPALRDGRAVEARYRMRVPFEVR